MKRPRVRISTLILLVVIVAGAGIATFAMTRPKSRHDLRVVRLFGGSDGLNFVLHPSSVEAYHIEPMAEGRGPAADAFPVVSGPVDVPSVSVQRLTSALTSPESYLWDVAKGCMPTYGVRLSFRRGGDRLDILLCMSCKMLLVVRDGVIVGGGNFDPIEPGLIEVVTALFPDDPAIQALRGDSASRARDL